MGRAMTPAAEPPTRQTATCGTPTVHHGKEEAEAEETRFFEAAGERVSAVYFYSAFSVSTPRGIAPLTANSYAVSPPCSSNATASPVDDVAPVNDHAAPEVTDVVAERYVVCHELKSSAARIARHCLLGIARHCSALLLTATHAAAHVAPMPMPRPPVPRPRLPRLTRLPRLLRGTLRFYTPCCNFRDTLSSPTCRSIANPAAAPDVSNNGTDGTVADEDVVLMELDER